ncbi:hypothetical protein N7925_04900 [Streptomyces sp. CA-278952]|uniref:hypothetical protein n=1 Tax=unclassified Streptomyces TaxID=2593676 RepID=UPI002368DB54|nr:hypothetical protein [Streptomyces sp. CA-278952]WDG27725.1 hypothetical protein N7925_04900 [Streptomyces sp. CA-278952]
MKDDRHWPDLSRRRAEEARAGTAPVGLRLLAAAVPGFMIGGKLVWTTWNAGD